MNEHFSSLQSEQHPHPMILLVDDSPTVLLQMRRMLEQAGFIVEEATNGEDTLSLFSQLKPDLVLLDVMMPGMDGFETCARLRQLPNGSRTPIIMLTSLDDHTSITRSYEVGATDFVTKPINVVILTHRLRYMLRGNRAMQELYRNETILQQTQTELEQRVRERTAQLEQSAKQLRQEVHERQRAEEELRTVHGRLQVLIDNSPLAVIEWDSQCRVRRWSAQAERIFGWRPEEVQGKHPSEWRFIPGEDQYITERVLTQISVGQVSHNVTRNRNYRKDGAIIDVEWYNSILRDESGAIVQLLSLAQDVTTRQEAERLKDELVSTVSHELRTPLTSLRGFTELMLKRAYPAHKQREFLSIIHGESVRLTNLINDFLDIQRMESGRQVYHFVPVMLSDFVHDTLALFSATDAKHHLSHTIPDSLPPVRADQDSLRQVLTNLLSNAIKFSPHGGAITINAQQEGQSVVVAVADHGVGIPPEAFPHLFGKFFRVDNQETRSIGGTGLGLALIKKIVEAHGGRVWADSKVGAGSTFFFTLPSMEQADESRPPRESTTNKARTTTRKLPSRNPRSCHGSTLPT